MPDTFIVTRLRQATPNPAIQEMSSILEAEKLCMGVITHPPPASAQPVLLRKALLAGMLKALRAGSPFLNSKNLPIFRLSLRSW